MLVAVVYFSLIHELPPVEDIESFFSTQEGEGFQAGRVWDRDREILLFELSHPLAADRRWLDLNPVGPDSLPQLAIQATLVSQDEDFWENEGYLVGRLIQNSIVGLLGRPVHEGNLTIAERLLETTLLSGSMPGQPFHALRRAGIPGRGIDSALPQTTDPDMVLERRILRESGFRFRFSRVGIFRKARRSTQLGGNGHAGWPPSGAQLQPS